MHCQYCGSIDAGYAIKALQTPGARFSGSDWKYGYPHKFYIEAVNPNADVEVEIGRDSDRKPIMGKRSHTHLKFYTRHILDATPEELKVLVPLFKAVFGIECRIQEDTESTARDIEFLTVRGRQWWGTIGPDGQPDFGEMRSAGFTQDN